MKHRLPKTPAEWLKEIQEAIADARETNRLGGRMGEPDTDDDLFLLAPPACLKFRGRELKGPEATRVTQAALAAYAVNSNPEGIDRGLKTKPLLAFALCYVAAHLALDLLDERAAETIMNECKERLEFR